MSQARARAISQALYTEPHVSSSAKFCYLIKRREASKSDIVSRAIYGIVNLAAKLKDLRP
jgi:hypothetical protein